MKCIITSKNTLKILAEPIRSFNDYCYYIDSISDLKYDICRNINDIACDVINKSLIGKCIWTKSFNDYILSTGNVIYDDYEYEKENKMTSSHNNRYNNKFSENIKNEVIKYTKSTLKNHFGVSLNLHLQPYTYRLFLKWLKKYDKHFKEHIIKKDQIYLKDVDFITSIDHRTYVRVTTQTAIVNALSEYDKRNNPPINEFDVNLYIFGKNAYREAKYIRENIINVINHGCYIITSSNNKYGDNNKIYYKEINNRSVNSVFLNDNIKENIINFTQNFFNNRSLYSERNLNYKTGILLYGEPGTGKTTISNMLSSVFNCDIVLINMSEFVNINTTELTNTINADDKTYFVVLEDIDCVIGDRNSETDDLENKKNVNKLLQFLDSTSSPNNVVFIATTNHIEKLDDAIIRDGRFDLTVNITNFDKNTAYKMCKSFGFNDTICKRILSENLDENETINPAKLQNIILKEREINHQK